MKSILHKNFATNKDLEKTGITIQYEDPDESDVPPVKIRIARAGGSNIAYDKAMDKKTRPLRRAIAANSISLHEIRRLSREVFAETVVLGWENVFDEEGEEIPFNVKNCIELFTKYPDLFTDIQQQADTAQLFRGQELEEDAKN